MVFFGISYADALFIFSNTWETIANMGNYNKGQLPARGQLMDPVDIYRNYFGKGEFYLLKTKNSYFHLSGSDP